MMYRFKTQSKKLSFMWDITKTIHLKNPLSLLPRKFYFNEEKDDLPFWYTTKEIVFYDESIHEILNFLIPFT